MTTSIEEDLEPCQGCGNVREEYFFLCIRLEIGIIYSNISIVYLLIVHWAQIQLSLLG